MASMWRDSFHFTTAFSILGVVTIIMDLLDSGGEYL